MKTTHVLTIGAFTIICALSANAQIKDEFPYRKQLYPDLNKKSWFQLMEEQPFLCTPPKTINMLIEPVHSPSWLYVNPSMAVSRRYLSTGITNNVEKTRAAQTQDDMLLQFAFDDPAFMPDFHLSTISLKDNRYSVPSVDYFANDLYYHIEYAATALNETQNALCVTISVKNESDKEKVANVRAKLGYYPEDKTFDYHYIPYFWDNTKWKPYDKISMNDYCLLKEGKPIGQVVPQDMKVEWEKSKTYTDKNYEDILYPQVWYGSGYALKQYRLYNIADVIHAYQTVKPNEVVRFSIKLLVDDAGATSEEYTQLAALTSQQITDKAITAFQKELDGDVVSLDFNKDSWPDVLSALQLSIKQMLVKYPGNTTYQTAQGGSSERFGVWTFEAVFMLKSMLRAGQFEDVKHGLEYLFSLQDAGCPPVGRFTTTAGSIGTTGPRWANSTGMALALACQYYLYSHDEQFLKAFLPKIMKAVHWIEGEVKATRKLNTDGSKPKTYGLMPWAVGCDGDTGYCLSDTDIYTYWGFNLTVQLLEQINHPEAEELRKQLEMYHTDILAAIESVRHENGFIERNIPEDGVEQVIQPKFEVTDNLSPMALVGIMEPTEDVFKKYMDFFERNFSNGEFMGGLDREIMYTNQCEHNWQQIYLRLGEWKKAFMLTKMSLKYGLSPDAHQTSERISVRNPEFAPWQPNGSANGRIIDIMLNAFYYENSINEITLLGPMPTEWLAETRTASLRHLYTLTGMVNMDITPVNDTQLLVSLSSDKPLPQTIVIPARFKAKSKTTGVKKSADEKFTSTKTLTKVQFLISIQ